VTDLEVVKLEVEHGGDGIWDFVFAGEGHGLGMVVLW
jgi:hypothetical protein